MTQTEADYLNRIETLQRMIARQANAIVRIERYVANNPDETPEEIRKIMATYSEG